MKALFRLLFFLPFCVFGQKVQVSVFDSSSGKPLPFANLYFQNAGIGASTNMEGVAGFDFSKISESDTLVVSYIGYKLNRVPYQREHDGLAIRIKLTANATNLSEVVVKYIKPPKPEKILKLALKNTEEN